jgi:integrase
MKTELDQALVYKLVFNQKPTKISGSKILETVANSAPYLITDSNQKSPPGFAVKVGKTKKTYLIQRRQGSKVYQVKVGNVGDYTSIETARADAQVIALKIEQSGQNPNVTQRIMEAAELTLGDCFNRYKKHLGETQEPATENTMIAFEKAKNKLKAFCDIKIKNLTSDQITSRFDEIFTKTPTTAEQTFRWASAAVEHNLTLETFEAKKAGRAPSLTINPFEILRITKRYRSRKKLEDAYTAKGIRKPMSSRDTLGPFLNAVWERRKSNRTGCDYLLVSLALGTRKMEAAELKWREDLSSKEAQECSWVDLKSKRIFFFDTKNRKDLTLPISAGLGRILSERQAMKSEFVPRQAQWVFPAKSKFSKTGHYSDGRSILKYICEDAKIERRASHDFRRTFGAVAEEITSYAMVKRLLNHSNLADPTSLYTEAAWPRVVEDLQRIEAHLLQTAPIVYNALLSPTFPPIQYE